MLVNVIQPALIPVTRVHGRLLSYVHLVLRNYTLLMSSRFPRGMREARACYPRKCKHWGRDRAVRESRDRSVDGHALVGT